MSHKEKGMKSAYELAMERLAKEGDAPASLTDQQREALARVDEEERAKVAELEIMYGQRLQEAEPQNVSLLQKELQIEIRRAHDRAESEKQSVRNA